MGKEKTPQFLQGTLDLLILRAVAYKTLHGYAIAEVIHRVSDGVLSVEEGSLYPALHRLELAGAIESEWGVSENKPAGEVLPDHGPREEAIRPAASGLGPSLHRDQSGAEACVDCFSSFASGFISNATSMTR